MVTRLIGLLALVVAVPLGAATAQAAGPPEIPAAWASGVAATSANVHALVNPNDLTTAVRTEYIAEAAYQANLLASPPRDGFSGASKAPAASSVVFAPAATDQPYLQRLAALKAGTTYRYRVVAVNPAGTAFGPTHTFTTTENAPAFSLPDGRAWEMVSPVDKSGGGVQGFGETFGGGVLQAAADGVSVTFSSRSSFGSAQGMPGAAQYVSRRGSGGWSTENVVFPGLSGGYGDEPDGVPYQLFSPDLASALLLDGHRCLAGEACLRSYSRRDNGSGALAHSPAAPDLALAGASADLKHAVLSTCAALTPAANEVPGPEGCDPAAANLYLWTDTGLALVNLLPGDPKGTPGATLGAQAGAVSADGARVYWRQQASGNLYLRAGGETTQVDAAAGGGGSFQTASRDGAVAYFTRGGHLYRYLAATGTTTDLTPAGGVEGVLGASEDGARVYYLGAAGLVLWSSGSSTTVAPAADAGNYPPAVGTARVTADGARLAFLSSANLTGYDSGGASQVFLYSIGGGLTCVSCNPTGGRPLGPSSLPAASANGKGPLATRAYKTRALAADGGRLFFDSFDALVPLDGNGDRDVYEWQAAGVGGCGRPGGCVSLLSSGQGAGGASFVDASADGADVFFLTDASLVASDPGSADLYDARVGGGFPESPPPTPCFGDACQAIPSPPEDPAVGSAFLTSSRNPPLGFPKAKPKKKGKQKQANHGKRHKKRHGKKAAHRRGGHR
jgi:hypothetical protein